MDVVDEAGSLRIVRVEGSQSGGERLVHKRGRATTTMTTDQLLRRTIALAT